MKTKRILLMSSCLGLLVLAGCGSTTQTTKNSDATTGEKFSQTYEIKDNVSSTYSLNGIVVSENTLTLVSARGGIIQNLNCQAGSKIGKGQVVATLSPDTSDASYQNYLVQRTSIENQISTLQSTISSTTSNFDTQISQQRAQRDNNNIQISILKSNIENQKTQGKTSGSDIQSQIKSLQDQIDYLKQSREKILESIASLDNSKKLVADSKSKDLAKINQNIISLKKQIATTLDSNFDAIDKLYGISENNKNKNSYGAYLGSKDQNLRESVKNDFMSIRAKLDNYSTMSNDQISAYLNEVGNYLSKVASSINMSVASVDFPQTQVDSLFASYNGLSNSIFTYKTNFDTLISSVSTTQNTYDNQISGTLEPSRINYENQIKTTDSNIASMTTSLQNLKDNKSVSTDVTSNTALNSLQSQLQSYIYSNENIDKQISSLQDNKNIQLNSLRTQLLTLNQNLQTVNNNLSGEKIVATKTGKVKQKMANIGNKVSIGTSICQITPDDEGGLKLQIYSPNKLELNTVFSFSKDGDLIGTGKIEFELPYKDQATQNFIYETSLKSKNLNEGDKVNIDITAQGKVGGAWVPVEYVVPRLDGYFVKVKNGDNFDEKKVEVGEINDGHIKVLSGVNKNDVLVK